MNDLVRVINASDGVTLTDPATTKKIETDGLKPISDKIIEFNKHVNEEVIRMSEFVSRQEFDQFEKRIDDKFDSLNKSIDELPDRITKTFEDKLKISNHELMEKIQAERKDDRKTLIGWMIGIVGIGVPLIMHFFF